MLRGTPKWCLPATATHHYTQAHHHRTAPHVGEGRRVGGTPKWCYSALLRVHHTTIPHYNTTPHHHSWVECLGGRQSGAPLHIIMQAPPYHHLPITHGVMESVTPHRHTSPYDDTTRTSLPHTQRIPTRHPHHACRMLSPSRSASNFATYSVMQ